MKKASKPASATKRVLAREGAQTSPRPSTASSSAAREPTDKANLAQVKKIVAAFYKTPPELKVPGWDREASKLQVLMHPSDFVPAVEAVSSVVERGGATTISIVVTVQRNGPLTLFYRRKSEIREKSLLAAVELPEVVPCAAMKLMKSLNKSLAMHNLQVLELVGLEITSPSLVELSQGLSGNKSLSTLCFNDSEIGDKGLLALLPSLQDHAKLSRLQLCRTGITDMSGRKLMEILRVQAERQTLSKWENSLRKEGQSASHGSGIRVVAISHNDLGSETFLALVHVLGLESGLKEIYARGCNPCLQSSNELQRCLDDTTMIRIMDMREARNVPGWIYDARSHPSLIFERSDLGQESSASNDSVQVSWEALSGGSDGTSQESPSQTLPMPASSHNHVERKGSPAPPAESALPVRSNILPRAVRYNGWDDGRKLVPSHQNTRQLGSVLPPELSREIKNISDELLASKLTPGIPRQRSCEDFLGSFASRAAQRRPFRTHLKRVDSLLDDTWVDSAGCNEVDPQGCLGVDEACAVLGEMKKLLRLQNKALLQAHQELFALRLHKAHQDGETAQGGESVDDEWTKSLETTIGMIAQKVEALEAARDRKVGPRGQNKSSSRRKEQEGEDNERVEASQTSQSLELVAGRLEEMWGGDSEED